MQEVSSLTLRDDEEPFSYTISKDNEGMIEILYKDDNLETSVYIQHQHLSDIINALKKML